MKTKTVALAVAGALTLAVALPGVAAAHTTISALQPQGSPLTSARTTYVVRSPNETPKQNTWKIVMLVPTPIQPLISVKHTSDWRIRIKKVATSQKDSEGNPISNITAVVWTARTKADEIAPSEFGEWLVRFQNPATAGQQCFGFLQYYRNEKTGSRKKPEVVSWTGSSTSETPASCITIADAPKTS
jgi:hypothetical protein